MNCPNCGCFNSNDAIKCNCGFKFDNKNIIKTFSNRISFKCFKCNAETDINPDKNPNDPIHCFQCGNLLKEEASKTNGIQSDKKIIVEQNSGLNNQEILSNKSSSINELNDSDKNKFSKFTMIDIFLSPKMLFLILLALFIVAPLYLSGFFSSGNVKNISLINSVSLPNGYKEAKWGMAKDEVIKTLSNAGLKFKDSKTDNNEEIVEFDMGNNKSLVCYFYKNQFYKAIYYPNLDEYDGTAAQGVVETAVKKYGQGKYKKYTDDLGIPAEEIIWEDNITKIKLFVHCDCNEVRYILRSGPYKSLRINFISKKYSELKEKTETEQQINIENEKKSSKIRETSKDL